MGYSQVLLLLWKNAILLKRQWLYTTFIVTFPMLIVLTLFLLNRQYPPAQVAVERYKPKQFYPPVCRICEGQDPVLGYSPNTTVINKVMSKVGRDMRIKIQGFSKARQLNRLVIKQENSTQKDTDLIIYGVIFPGSYNNSLPKKVKYTIRNAHPLGLKFRAGFTNTKQHHEHQRQDLGDSSFDFNQVKSAVDFAIISYLDKKNQTPPMNFQLWMQQFPWRGGSMQITSFIFSIPIINVACFILLVSGIIKELLLEKESGLRESMKIMGLKSAYHWHAWFYKNLLLCFFIVISTSFFWTDPLGKQPILERTSVTLFIFYQMLYGIDCIMFAFLMSTIFTKAKFGAVMTSLIFFATHLFDSFYIEDNYDDLNPSIILLYSLLHNVAMGRGLHIFYIFELEEVGAKWSNAAEYLEDHKDISLAQVMGVMVFDAFLYGILTWYIDSVHPGQYGIPEPYLFPFYGLSRFLKEKVRWRRDRVLNISQGKLNISALSLDSNYFETNVKSAKPGIQMRNLRKVFTVEGRRKVAVDNVSIDFYENEITVLLGHNGAGKTTLISLLTGLAVPTQGHVAIKNIDISKDMNLLYQSMGNCPQHNILFASLTVEEHLKFFAQLKGLKKEKMKKEVEEMLKILNLRDKRKVLSKRLSGGLKRRLSVGIALIGESKVVFLDEPTAGVDPEARREIWDMLQANRKDRTIILTTHHMDEADILGDRIAIMAHGTIRCCGSSIFLKDKYGVGYHLMMEKLEGCDEKAVTDLVMEHVPTATLEDDIGTELSYKLPKEYTSQFGKLFAILEDNQAELHISGLGASITTMEEVFLRVGQLSGHGKRVRPSMVNVLKAGGIVGKPAKKNTGIRLLFQQFKALVIKRLFLAKAEYFLHLAMVIIPMVTIGLTLTDSKPEKQTFSFSPITLDAHHFEREVIVAYQLNSSDLHPNYIKDTFKPILASIVRPQKFRLIESKDIQNFTTAKSTQNHINRGQVYGFDLQNSDEKLMGFYPPILLHSPSVLLGMLTNLYLKEQIGVDYEIVTNNHVYPFTYMAGNSDSFASSLDIGLILGTCLLTVLLIRERINNIKHSQVVGGISICMYWFANYICDLMVYFVLLMVIMVMTTIAEPHPYGEDHALGYLTVVILAYGWAIIPWIYLVSFLFKIPITGYLNTSLFTHIIGTVTHLVYQFLLRDHKKDADIVKQFSYIFSPAFSLAISLSNLKTFLENRKACYENCDNKYSGKCFNECFGEDNVYKMKSPGLGEPLLSFLYQGFIFIFLVMLIESRLCLWILQAIEKMYAKKTKLEKAKDQDEDVVKEEKRLKSLRKKQLAETDVVVLADLKKYYKNFVAVRGLYLGIPKGQCFGLIGTNGAGKTSTFKMLTGNFPIAFGDAYLQGSSVKTALRQAQKDIGYCPQFEALNEELTCRQTLNFYANLKGMTSNRSSELVTNAMERLNILEFSDVRVMNLSGGNKRKLSTAVALIGDPQIIFLDEPTAGVDPAAKRYLWDLLSSLRANGKTIVLTSHSMEECEALCSRMAIMVKGEFKCLGSIQHLKTKFGKGYSLVIKLDTKTPKSLDDLVLNLKNFIHSTFRCKLNDQHGPILYYTVEGGDMTWSSMFTMLEEAKSKYDIEDYTLSQTTLEQIFVNFAKQQEEAASGVNFKLLASKTDSRTGSTVV